MCRSVKKIIFPVFYKITFVIKTQQSIKLYLEFQSVNNTAIPNIECYVL